MLLNNMNTRQAAAYLGVSASAMEKWRRRLVGPKFFRAGGLVRYWRADLDAYIAAQTVDPAG